jgi:hypothetical protein
MTDDFNDIMGQLGPEDEDIKKHLEGLTETIKNKIRNRAQAKYEAMTVAQLKTEIQAISAQRLMTATDLIVGVLSALAILGVSVDRRAKLAELAEFEAILFKLLEMPGVPDSRETIISDLVEANMETSDEFIKEHTKGEHVGCMFDEWVRKSEEDNDWPTEFGGGEDNGID